MSGIVPHACPARGQRSRNAQPAPSLSSDGVDPLICFRRCPGAVAAGTESSSPREYGWRGASRTSPASPISTMRPAYITAIRSARPATTARSCVIQISEVPDSRVSFCIS